MTPDFRCAAHTYRLNASGRLHFAFSSSVLPWDHAAGWLIHREAGGFTAHFDGSPYRPVNRGGGLISAPDQETWHVVRDALLDGHTHNSWMLAGIGIHGRDMKRRTC
jgi:fructose-1,6-bisphosphatase/inositol monophosphatase family enzyme